MTKQKGFFSIITLMYILIIIVTTETITPQLLEIGTMTLAETQKQSKIITIEQIIENNLDNDIENTFILKQMINLNLIAFFEENPLFVYNIIDKQKQELTFEKLDELSNVIVYKPSKHMLIKIYTITNGRDKNKFVSVNLKNINYKTSFLFPEGYTKRVIVYKL